MQALFRPIISMTDLCFGTENRYVNFGNAILKTNKNWSIFFMAAMSARSGSFRLIYTL